MGRTPGTPIERFEALVDRQGAHHRWTGSPDPRTGTGQFRIAGKLRSAQRAAWELQVGPIPSGVRVRACPNDPLCVRIEHLGLEPSQRNITPSRASSEPNRRMSLSTAFPLYLAHLGRCGRAERTLAIYRSIYHGWLDRRLGPLRLDQLTPRKLGAALSPMTEQVPQSATVAKSILNGLMDWAVEEGLLPRPSAK
jgi:HNH endonuclease